MKEFNNFISMGNDADAKGDKTQAIEFYKKAHNLNKKSVIPLSNLAIVYYETGDYKTAEKYAKQAVKADKNNSSAYVILGNLYFADKNFSKALEYYINAYELNISSITSVINIANTYIEMKMYNDAKKYAKKIIELSPSMHIGYSIIGNIYKELEQYDDAIKNLNIAIEYNDTDAWTYNYLSQSYQKKGDYKKALDVGYKSIELCNSGNVNNHHINFGYMLYEISLEDKKLAEKYARIWLEKYAHNNIVKHMAKSILNNELLSKANDEYLRNIFDVFAPDFDIILAGLNYHGPELVNKMLQEIYGKILLKKLKILDAGCGTGLCGKYLKKYAKISKLHGVDISSEMIRYARYKKIYNELYIEEIISFLSHVENEYDLIVSSDVFIYFGSLEELFAKLYTALSVNGRVIYTISENTENEDIYLHASGRFAHSKIYIEKLAEKNNFKIEKMYHEHIRNEGGKPVFGYVISMIKK